jgi:hypothetical protein
MDRVSIVADRYVDAGFIITPDVETAKNEFSAGVRFTVRDLETVFSDVYIRYDGFFHYVIILYYT